VIRAVRRSVGQAVRGGLCLCLVVSGGCGSGPSVSSRASGADGSTNVAGAPRLTPPTDTIPSVPDSVAGAPLDSSASPDPQWIVAIVDSVDTRASLGEWIRVHPADSVRRFDATNYQPNSSGGAGFESGIWCAVATDSRSTDTRYFVREAYFFPPAETHEQLGSIRQLTAPKVEDCTLGMIAVDVSMPDGEAATNASKALRAAWEGPGGAGFNPYTEERPWVFDRTTGFRLASGRRFRAGWRGDPGVGAHWNEPWFTDEDAGQEPRPHRTDPPSGPRRHWPRDHNVYLTAVGLFLERGIGHLEPGTDMATSRDRPPLRAFLSPLLASSTEVRTKADEAMLLLERIQTSGDSSSKSGLLRGGTGARVLTLVDSLRVLADGDSAVGPVAAMWLHLLVRGIYGPVGSELPRQDSLFVMSLKQRGTSTDWDHYNDGYYYADNWLDRAAATWNTTGEVSDLIFASSLEGRWSCIGDVGGTREDLPARLKELRRWRQLVTAHVRPRVDLEIARIWSDSLAWSDYYLTPVQAARDSAISRYADALSDPQLPNAEDQVWPEAWILAAGLLPTRVWNYCSLND